MSVEEVSGILYSQGKWRGSFATLFYTHTNNYFDFLLYRLWCPLCLVSGFDPFIPKALFCLIFRNSPRCPNLLWQSINYIHSTMITLGPMFPIVFCDLFVHTVILFHKQWFAPPTPPLLSDNWLCLVCARQKNVETKSNIASFMHVECDIITTGNNLSSSPK